jgi:hypothetical protein
MRWLGHGGAPGVAPERDRRPNGRLFPPRSRDAAAADATGHGGGPVAQSGLTHARTASLQVAIDAMCRANLGYALSRGPMRPNVAVSCLSLMYALPSIRPRGAGEPSALPCLATGSCRAGAGFHRASRRVGLVRSRGDHIDPVHAVAESSGERAGAPDGRVQSVRGGAGAAIEHRAHSGSGVCAGRLSGSRARTGYV